MVFPTQVFSSITMENITNYIISMYYLQFSLVLENCETINVIPHKLHEKWTVWWRPVEIEGSEKISPKVRKKIWCRTLQTMESPLIIYIYLFFVFLTMVYAFYAKRSSCIIYPTKMTSTYGPIQNKIGWI